MTNRTALALGILLLTGIVVDASVYDARNMIFLGKKFFDLTEWLAFWR